MPKTKALIIGAPPSPFTGPSVSLGGGEKWKIVPEANYEERVVVAVKRNGSTTRHPLTGEELVVAGDEVQAEILEGANELGLDFISVNIERVA